MPDAPAYKVELIKELKRAKDEIKEDQEIKERMMKEIADLKKAANEARWRGDMIVAVLRMMLQGLKQAFGVFGIKIEQELEERGQGEQVEGRARNA